MAGRTGGLGMDLDDELCLCFHVTKRKVINYLRVEKPRRAGELSHCFGAATGCGWCRPFLERLFQRHQRGELVPGSDPGEGEFPTAERYADARAIYLQKDDD
jgi:bacterioferritin-associated ferredoxin